MGEVHVELGGRKLLVRPASLKSVKRWLTAQKEVRVGTPEYLEEVEEFVFATLKRGNADIDREWLTDELDERNIGDVIGKIYEAGRIVVGEQTRPPENQ